jgi:hypothetical protein
VPVGLLAPAGRLAGDLAFQPEEGVGRHWQAVLGYAAYTDAQLPDPVGPVSKPAAW